MFESGQNVAFSLDKLYIDAQSFLSKVEALLIEKKIDTNIMQPDHICFRVQSQAEYMHFKQFLGENSLLLTEEIVNGRPICTYRFEVPFKFQNKSIYLLELPSPKLNNKYQTGFEHIEFVTKDSFEKIKFQYTDFDFKLGGNAVVNPELSLALSDNVQIKFHHSSLDRVIELEKASIKDVVFDMDGTLATSHEKIYKINQKVFSEILGRELSLQEVKEKYFPEFASTFKAYGITDQKTKEKAAQLWRDISNQYHFDLFSGVHDLLKFLNSKNIKCHIWTARDTDSTIKILKYHHIESFFETVSGSNRFHSKPNSENLLFDWQNAEKDSALMIGDSTTDMLAAKNTSLIAAAALWDPYVSEDNLIATGAELFFKSISDFQNWFTR
jgi:HAD superfamily hydrolase (TIGR01549 family)